MQKKFLAFLIGIMCFVFTQPIVATGLWEVYQEALKNDPVFKAALAERMAESEIVSQSQALLLPQINFSSTAGFSRTKYDIEGAVNPLIPEGKLTWKQHNIGFNLSLSQTVLNLSHWQNLAAAKKTVKASVASYNAASQDLMKRTVNAFLNVLQAREVLRFARSEKEALYNEYQRAYQSFKVGVKTITDMYNAKAAYDESVARYVTAKNDLENSKEDLRVITGVLYYDLDWLKQSFPLISPDPADVDQWVKTAVKQNWELVAARYTALALHNEVKAAQADHFPVIEISAQYGDDYTRISGAGTERKKGPSAGLNLNVPIYTGGAVSSQVRQAMAEYQLANSQQEQIYRRVLNETRKAYLGIVSDMSKLEADKQAIISNQSSLKGMREGYKVGVRTIIDVLNAEKSLYGSQKNYAVDRYHYIRDSINLKLAAGTLSEQDLLTIHQWLGKTVCHKNCKKYQTN